MLDTANILYIFNIFIFNNIINEIIEFTPQSKVIDSV